MHNEFSLCFRLVVKNVGINAAREAAKKQVLDLKFDPKGDTSLSQPKFGKEDPNNEAHTGGNTWAGGVSLRIRISFREYPF